MGCSASVEAKSSENTEAQILQSDNALRRQLAATLISSDMNDSSILLKMLDNVYNIVQSDKARSSGDSFSGSSKSKGKSLSKGSSNSKFNQLLESRRQQQDEVMGRSPRSNSLASIRVAPVSPTYSNARGSRGNGSIHSIPDVNAATVGPAHSEEMLRCLPYNAKLMLQRLLRHPIGFTYYWYFIHHLDRYSSVMLSPNVEKEMQENVSNGINSLQSLGIIPNTSISHIPSKATESPYESVFLLFTQLDMLTRLGTVPPQTRNPFEYIIHFNDDTSKPNAQNVVLSPRGGGTTAKKPQNKYLDGNWVFPRDPFTDYDIGVVEPESTGDSEDVLRRKSIEAQRQLQNQYVVQASIIHGHRVFYEQQLARAVAIEDSFLHMSSPMNAVPQKFNKDPFYNPASLQQGVSCILPSNTLDLLNTSLGEYIRCLRTVLKGVIVVDEQHQRNVKTIETFEQSGGIGVGYNPKYIFSSMFNEYYTDLDFYRVGIVTPIVPNTSNTSSKVMTSLSIPYIVTGGSISTATKDGDVSSDSDSDDDVISPTAQKHGKNIPAANKHEPIGKAYQFNALCAAPTTIYIPDMGVRLAREQILAFLSAYTLSPFLMSNYYQGFKLQVMNSTLIGSMQQQTGSVPIMSNVNSNMGGHNGAIRKPSFFNSVAPATGAVSINTQGNVPPQAILMECIKSSGLSAFAGYCLGTQSTIGAGPMPLQFLPGNCLVSNISCKRETLHPLHGTSVLYGGLHNQRRKSLPGIVTKNVVGQISNISLGAIDLTNAFISRELAKAFCVSSSLVPSNIGFSIISMVTPSSSHRQHLKAKQSRVDLDSLFNGMSTMKVVYTNNEFSRMCGATDIVGMGVPQNEARDIASPRLSNRATTAVPVAGRRPSMDPSLLNPSGLSYLSVLGRDIRGLFIDEEDKTQLLNDMMALKPIHTFAKLASSDHQQYTQVILSMKPVYIRYRKNNGILSTKSIQGTPLSIHSYSAQEYDVDDRDLDSFDNTAVGYQGTYIAPLFYICTAVRAKAPALVPSVYGDLHSTRITPVEKDAVCSEYSRFPQPQPFFSSSGLIVEKKGKKHSLEDQDMLEFLQPYSSVRDTDIFSNFSLVEKKEMLRLRWAHDTAWQNIFPNMHDVT